MDMLIKRERIATSEVTCLEIRLTVPKIDLPPTDESHWSQATVREFVAPCLAL